MPLSARQTLDNYFLETRAKLLDLAAILDRIQRGTDGDHLDDIRLDRINAAIKMLLEKHPTRAELVQELFSLPYDPHWNRPTPHGPANATVAAVGTTS